MKLGPKKNRRSTGLQWRKLAAGAAAATVVLLGIAPAASQAVTLDAITSVVINPDEPGKPISLYDGIEIEAKWAAPAGAQAGDQFELTFPDVITGQQKSFDLRDDSGNLVGSCEVLATKIVCTLADFVESHENVSGSLHFFAQATKETEEQELTWNEGTEHEFHTNLEGGIGPFVPELPGASQKWSSQTTDGYIEWRVLILGSDLVTPGGNDVTLVDTYDERLTLDPSRFYVEAATTEEYMDDTWVVLGEGQGAEQYEVTFGTSSYILQIHAADSTKYYRAVYSMPVPDGTVDGSLFKNSVTADGKDFVENTLEYQDAGGNGSGVQKNGAINWNKVDPDGAALKGSEWALTDASGTAIRIVDNGDGDSDPLSGKLSVHGLAWGTYTLKETKAPAGYVMSGEEKVVTISAGMLTIEIGDIVNRPAAITPPPEPPTTSPTTPKVPDTPDLAQTGSASAPWGMAASILVIVGLSAAFLGRKSTRTTL